MRNWLILLLAVLTACGQSSSKGPVDTPTQGKIHIAVDEAFAPLIAAEINAFQGLYQMANIVPHYVSETKAYEMLMADSVRLVISSRDFSESERNFFKEKTNVAHSYRTLKFLYFNGNFKCSNYRRS